MKYLLWALLLYLAWRWYSAQKQKGDAPAADDAATPAASTPAATSAANAPVRSEAMVRCASCGIHLPVSEALPAPGDLHFCSEAHRARHDAH